MSSKFKRVSPPAHPHPVKDNTNLRTVVGLIVIAVIAVGLAVWWSLSSAKPQSTANNASTAAPQAPAAQGPTPVQLQRVQQYEAAVKANPTSQADQKDLGNAYDDVGFAYLEANDINNMQTYFAKAVTAYQKYLAKTYDINVQTDMATAAFYAGNNTLAEASFKQALAKDPGFAKAHLNYGIFLYMAKNDPAGAKTQLEIVAKQNQDPTSAQTAKNILQQIK